MLNDGSGGQSTKGSPTTISRRILGLDWRNFMPLQFDDVTAEVATFDEAQPFVEEHYGTIFGALDQRIPFFAEPMSEAKRRFGAEMDVFLFRHLGRSIGVLMSHPSDWSTYYMRTSAFLPDYRRSRLASRFMDLFWAPLAAAGIARVECDASPANIPVNKLFLSQGFVVTSVQASDRWGTLLRYTKFLNEDAERAFAGRLCGMSVGLR